MHLRGKSFEIRAALPDGQEQILLPAPRYDFNGQTNYRLDPPAGSRVRCTARCDNSAGKLNNPDSAVPVRWGEQTWER